MEHDVQNFFKDFMKANQKIARHLYPYAGCRADRRNRTGNT
ncbi:MAG: hypothetical protein WCQ99_14355 [Pseudomonadota bacterium]